MDRDEQMARDTLHDFLIGITPKGLRKRKDVNVGCGDPDCRDCYEPTDRSENDASM